MMVHVQLAIALLLLMTMLAGLIRVWLGPTAADRMLAAQLFGTTGVGVLLLLAGALGLPSALDVALVLALLAAVTVVVFVRRVWVPAPGSQEEQNDRE
jgi:multicomponent Na+:H+ antiporter subunit F